MKHAVHIMFMAVALAGCARADWTRSYEAGHPDANGVYAGGSEIMHLAAHKGKLYAANGYWKDARWEVADDKKQSTQVLRLDAADGKWQVDLDLGKTNGLGLHYMKGNILKSVVFTRDREGKPLPKPQNLLIMASGAYKGGDGHVSVWVRDDPKGAWTHTLVLKGSTANRCRWVPRDMEVYRDKVTGVERLFLLLGNPGITSGVYDASAPGRIRWDKDREFPKNRNFGTRPLGIVKANGSLLFSVGGLIYRRIDGLKPTYVEVMNLSGSVNTDVGGIRGLTAIPNPKEAGQSVLFMWTPRGNAAGTIKRLDPDGEGGYTAHDEVNIRDLMSKRLGVAARGVLGGYNNLYPVVHPRTRENVHIIGFQGTLNGGEQLMWKGSRYYAGALYAVRAADQTYTVQEVNGRYAQGKPVLVSPRTFVLSPFGDGTLFVAGHDANFRPSSDMAWVFKASVDVALGVGEKP